MSGAVAIIFEQLLAAIAADCPAASAAISARACGFSLAVRVDGEPFGVAVGSSSVTVGAVPAAPAARIDLTVTTLCDLLLGADDPLSALCGERLHVFGAPRDLARLDDLVGLLVAGAARSSGAEPLLDRLIALARPADPGHPEGLHGAD